MKNPTVDEAFDRCFQKMDQGAGAHYVLPEAHAALKRRYHCSFFNKLEEEGAWAQEGGQVLNAAYQIGAVAGALAHLGQRNEIDEDLALMAGKLIEERCRMLFARGRWCEPDPLPGSRQLEALLEDHHDALAIGDPEAVRTVYLAARPLLHELMKDTPDRGARKAVRFLLEITDTQCGLPSGI